MLICSGLAIASSAVVMLVIPPAARPFVKDPTIGDMSGHGAIAR
jgi:hypothetical protein